MSTSRRSFLKTSALAGGALGLGLLPGAAHAGGPSTREMMRDLLDVGPAAKPLRILILGGTGLTGPRQVAYALKRGHKVTTFNRGRRSKEVPAAVEQLHGDRNVAGGLEALKGREWDVVIDNPTTIPVWVRDAGEILQGKTNQFIFISTISVYADTSKPGFDETTALAQYEGEDPLKETMQTFSANQRLYGPLKVASEREAEKWFPGKTTIIRPGLIVGPGDTSGRWNYWPIRISEGGEVLAPGTGDDFTQIIDSRDLAEWTIRMAENNTVGTFNATGPKPPMKMKPMLEQIRKALKKEKDVSFTWVPAEFLQSQQVRGWSQMPAWVPPSPDNAGFMQVNVDRAVKAGLTYRSVADTARATMDWYNALPDTAPPPAQPATPPAPGTVPPAPVIAKDRVRGGLPKQKEAEVLAAWKAKTP
jgi:2'-hydroxyisoflavone reductase